MRRSAQVTIGCALLLGAVSLQAPKLFTIAQDLRQMQVEADVDEADIGRVSVGQPAAFTVDAYPGSGRTQPGRGASAAMGRRIARDT